MAGHIQDRGNGSFLLVYHVGYDSNGKRIRKTRTVKAKNSTEAKKKLAAFVTEIETGQYVAPSHTRFGDYVEVWRKQAQKKLAPTTLQTYNYAIDKRILPFFSHFKMEDITHVHLNGYIEDLEEEGLASSYIKKQINILSNIFDLALKNEVIKKNPTEKVELPKVNNKEGQVYNSKELKELFQLLKKENNKQQVLIVKLALKTGMRKGELLALTWDDVDFNTNTIHIRRSLGYTKTDGYILKEPKTKGSIRKVAPPRKLMEELRRHKLKKSTERIEAKELWQGGQHFFVFSTDLGKPFFLDVPSTWWKRFLERHNFKKIRFHDLRHTAATDLINKGANIHSISKRLGHTNISTTLNIYGHYLEEADQKIADMLDEDYI
ncbi:site-specific integrase [Gracilibacillus sp. S3-1-1]|uniref:Site-specific integrase n=1 Tax=Gracilibacillus pellucidus TaxID=3095368 RepID=A0ACC6M3F1_9BACI|nr:site-specific integrase [Gracilibacillus sp. S3-1-1]MDX8045454.1 site-specific integrase [Gracilibacillus sp. S3-1-1]